ncbi:hypothetical protein FE257_011988 [Aspergillus nanangensis]|uniref:NADH:flavin oxidoreductase/NADH oxidase N-terminal domain-containing protein n=1 Tax=Aspergillus nanangensis TaxID=2582783 RepID=A0AAD4CH51_ASPNN|nr:hypothetical protein FE257_011988 [Aspergillus nanangensis]
MSKLSSPIQIGAFPLQHRIVLAPLTRIRASDNHTPLDMAREYYAQRASVPGTLLISEGTFITAAAGGMPNVPGIWSSAQIAQWKTITAAVHAQGSSIVCQLWALGRAANPTVLSASGNYDVISSSNRPMSESSPHPRALSEGEIAAWIADYAQAAKNAIAAGFDGVEIHGANGYLCDQFLQDGCNDRTDRWGGSVENRARFGVEVAKAVAAAVGAERTGYRISPWSPFQGMGMPDRDMKPQFEYLVRRLGGLGLAYVHVVEPRISGSMSIEGGEEEEEEGGGDEASFVFEALEPYPDTAVILAGGFTAQSAEKTVEKYDDRRKVAIAFGRHFLANPDLPFRLAGGLRLNPYERATFYTPKSPVGYTDYPFSPEFLAAQDGGQH